MALSATIVSCNDWLEQEPVSKLTPEGFFTQESQVEAAANQLYQDVINGHGVNTYSYGMYADDNNTDNQMAWTPDNKYGTGLWLVPQDDKDNWKWNNIRNTNYQLNTILAKYNAKEVNGNEENIRQYIGEIYFMRAYAYFDMLKKYGDMPIVTEAMPDVEATLVAANKRRPCNEVARFIIANIDTALLYLKPNFEARHTRISPDAAKLFKSRVALYEGSWLTYFDGTPFVPGGPGWPGATRDYNAGYQYPTGSIGNEAKYFLELAATSAEEVAEKYKGQLVTNTGTIPQKLGDPENPYFNIWGTNDMSGTPEVLLWREYSKALGVGNCVEVSINRGNNGVGVTRGLVETYLMKDGLPRYASSYTYSDQTIADVAKDRDPRLTIFLKVPGQVNCFKNMESTSGDQYQVIEPAPAIYNHNADHGYVTGYTLRKGGMFDKSQTGNAQCENAACIFRATEALLNYMEAEYMLTENRYAGHILEYWRIVREKAGFTGNATDPERTIAATDMAQENGDWGAYSKGTKVDAVLYNIRRERRSELVAEGLRWMDLQRWRALDQLATTPVHIEGIHLFNTPQQNEYEAGQLISDGSASATVSSPSLSEYLRPNEINMVNNNFENGLTWHKAHYLRPIPIKQFMLTASDYASPDKSPLYQNPYWPTTTDTPAEQ